MGKVWNAGVRIAISDYFRERFVYTVSFCIFVRTLYELCTHFVRTAIARGDLR